jgi:hypothetical protein
METYWVARGGALHTVFKVAGREYGVGGAIAARGCGDTRDDAKMGASKWFRRR